MRYRLRTLLILLAVGPPIIGGYAWLVRREIRHAREIELQNQQRVVEWAKQAAAAKAALQIAPTTAPISDPPAYTQLDEPIRPLPPAKPGYIWDLSNPKCPIQVPDDGTFRNQIDALPPPGSPPGPLPKDAAGIGPFPPPQIVRP